MFSHGWPAVRARPSMSAAQLQRSTQVRRALGSCGLPRCVSRCSTVWCQRVGRQCSVQVLGHLPLPSAKASTRISASVPSHDGRKLLLLLQGLQVFPSHLAQNPSCHRLSLVTKLWW